MTLQRQPLLVFLLAAILCPPMALGQKIKVEYDKSVDFAKYKTYTWAQLNLATAPLLRANILAAVDDHMKAKGLTKVDSGGDLVVSYAGALEGEANTAVSAPAYPGYSGPPPAVDSTVWTGSAGSSGSGMSVSYPKGSLVLEMMDPSAGKITWRAVGRVKLDLEKKKEALGLVDNMISKMFDEYPPKSKQ